jgi:HAD superfamily phosphoserine phosphatase-like hydrolase
VNTRTKNRLCVARGVPRSLRLLLALVTHNTSVAMASPSQGAAAGEAAGAGGPGAPPPASAGKAVVFDFDWSLINENSDYWLPAQLRPELDAYIRENEQKLQFTALVADVARRMHDHGITRAQIESTLARIPVYPECLEAMRLAKARGARVMIVSDANEVFIGTVLRHHGVDGCVDAVVTNRAHFDGECLVIA